MAVSWQRYSSAGKGKDVSDYIVNPFRKPKTPILKGLAGERIRCPECGNDDQNRFLTVTSLGGDTFQGAVCAPCEREAIDSR